MLTISIITFLLGCFGWYILHGLEGFLNGFMYKNQFTMPFHYWYSNFVLLWPSNRERYIYILCQGDKNGWIDDYRIQDIIDKNLYREVGNKTLPGIGHFIVINVFPFIIFIGTILIWINL